MFAECLAGVWLAEISADLRGRAIQMAAFTLLYFTLLYVGVRNVGVRLLLISSRMLANTFQCWRQEFIAINLSRRSI